MLAQVELLGRVELRLALAGVSARAGPCVHGLRVGDDGMPPAQLGSARAQSASSA